MFQNYENCAAFLKQSAKNPTSAFNNLCNEATESGEADGLNLNSFLIMPVQRLPRYKLLLADLVNKTWTSKIPLLLFKNTILNKNMCFIFF